MPTSFHTLKRNEFLVTYVKMLHPCVVSEIGSSAVRIHSTGPHAEMEIESEAGFQEGTVGPLTLLHF